MFESENVMLTLTPQMNREGRILSPSFKTLEPWENNQIDLHLQ